jgi:hypothetical protein
MSAALKALLRTCVMLCRFAALDTAEGAGEPITRQLASAFECALMDIWAQVSRVPQSDCWRKSCA